VVVPGGAVVVGVFEVVGDGCADVVVAV
ncbi:MAG: hypothetical protein QOH95_459, partial [Gaiellaceae bacterium]|nr:hypothetical protein [Gaiellaceae bacterium]